MVRVSAALATLVLVFAWGSSAGGGVQGSIAVGANCMVSNDDQDTPPNSRCTETPVNGATVVVASSDGPTLNVRTDDRGSFRLNLPAGTYMVGAWVTRWQGLGNKRLRAPINGAATLRPIRVARWATVRVDISLAWYAL